MMPHARFGTFWKRLTQGVTWSWHNDADRTALPADFDHSVMRIHSNDRFHAKQGRSTARVVFHSGEKPLAVYLKRHRRLSVAERLAGLVLPKVSLGPARAEWENLELVRSLGVDVPRVVAVGETLGPWIDRTAYLMVEELADSHPLHEAVPDWFRRLSSSDFFTVKLALIQSMAEITAKIHSRSVFHKDLYLCHFFAEQRPAEDDSPRLALIDLHRTARHRFFAFRWLWKDLGQLLFSSFDVEGISDRDRLRFWVTYSRLMKLTAPRLQYRAIKLKAMLYRRKNH